MNTFIKENYLLGYYEITVLTYRVSPKKLINFTLQCISKQNARKNKIFRYDELTSNSV
jgi:hypothetical protein